MGPPPGPRPGPRPGEPAETPVLRVAFLADTRQPAVVLTDLLTWLGALADGADEQPAAAAYRQVHSTLTHVLADAVGRAF